MTPTLLPLALLACLALPHVAVSQITLSQDIQNFAIGEKRDIIIEMEPVLGHALTSPSIASLTGNARRNQIIKLIKQRTEITQKPVLKVLKTLGLKSRTKAFWVANRISVQQVDLATIQSLSKIPSVSFVIREPKKAKIFPIVVEEGELSIEDIVRDGVQYGVEKIKAPECWKEGFNGTGVVVGIIDTGVNMNHIALKDNYLNTPYAWKDAFGVYDKPYDGNQHGTHCTGSICGTTNGIGVAPGAKWMACRGLDDEGSGNETTLVTCGQFMACPQNTTGNCSGFPDAVSNSWGGLVGGSDFYNEVINTWRSLNIVPVFALGNSGPICMSAGSPGDQDNLISVGATDASDKVTSFSSRGPALGTGKTKPEVSAPGNKIVSATHDSNDKYRALSGTSMACPHVAGAVAILLSANRGAKFDQILDVLEKNAVKPFSNFWEMVSTCTVPPNKVPSNAFGWGRIDVYEAMKKLQTPAF